MTKPFEIAPDNLGPTACIGEILAEIVATTVGTGFDKIQPLMGPYPSGAAAIFIDQCGRIGGSAAMIGAIGNDDFGHLNIERLRRDGVDVSNISINPDLPTGTAFVRYRKDGERDFIFNMWTSAAGSLTWKPELEIAANRFGHLHVMGTLLAHENIWLMIERTAHIIKERGGTISLDPNWRKELGTDSEVAARLSKIIAMSDLLLPSGDELYLAAGLDPSADEETAIQQLFDLGVSEVVLKRGAAGSTCFQKNRSSIQSCAFPVREIDPTGAGDCFGGAYIACRRLGLTVVEAMTYANAAGARSVTYRGPMEGAGTRKELDLFIASNHRGS